MSNPYTLSTSQINELLTLVNSICAKRSGKVGNVFTPTSPYGAVDTTPASLTSSDTVDVNGSLIQASVGAKLQNRLLDIRDFVDKNGITAMCKIPDGTGGGISDLFSVEQFDYLKGQLSELNAKTCVGDLSEVSDCRAACTGFCAASCIGFCNGCNSCTGSCTGSCSTVCYTGCNSGCKNTCNTKCQTSCNTTCYTGCTSARVATGTQQGTLVGS